MVERDTVIEGTGSPGTGPGAQYSTLSTPSVALVLEDGSAFVGTPFGAEADAEGEVVFNTSMAGYQEICSDPSYRGQMVVLTHPQVGNYGISRQDAESTRPWVAALIVRDLAPVYHHWQAEMGLDEYLRRWGVPGLQGVDTRAITRRLRERGTMRAVLRRLRRGDEAEREELRQAARQVASLSEQRLVEEVSGAGAQVDAALPPTTPLRIVVLDCGVKHNIVRSLRQRGVETVVLEANAGAEEILAARPDGIVLSNGPGDPAVLEAQVAATRRLMESGVPIFGICLGHQMLALALGATTSRLKFGHHGGNHPVKDLQSGRVHITSQNHEFQVDADSLPPASGFVVSHVNLNDGSVEGLAHPTRPIFSVQFHPEGSPGPQDNQYLFDRFLDLVARQKRSAES